MQEDNLEKQPLLTQTELVQIDGGVTGDGQGGGCTPNPLDKLIPTLPTFPEQPY